MAGFINNGNGRYSVNYDDQRFQDVKNEQTQKEQQINNTYNDIISNSDKFYQDQINATNDYKNTQSELQQAQTDFTIEQINQQKEQAEKDYTKEQKASYVDYMKQTKSNAQNMSNSGLSNTGFSESSIVSMYNQYQSRVGTAKESLNRSILNYNNSIQQAQLANNEKLAEIAYNALQTQNQLNQQAFEYKNSMILEREKQLENINNIYYARYQDVLSQINNEIDLQMKLDEIDREYDKWLKEFEQKEREFEESQRQFKLEYNLKKKQLAESQRQFNLEYKLKKSQSSSSSNPYRNSSNSSKSNKSSMTTDAYNTMLNSIKTAKKSGYTSTLKKWISTIDAMVENGSLDKSRAGALMDIIDG